MHPDAFGCIGTRSENFGNVGPKNAIFAFLEGILTAWTSASPFVYSLDLVYAAWLLWGWGAGEVFAIF